MLNYYVNGVFLLFCEEVVVIRSALTNVWVSTMVSPWLISIASFSFTLSFFLALPWFSVACPWLVLYCIYTFYIALLAVHAIFRSASSVRDPKRRSIFPSCGILLISHCFILAYH